MRTSADTKTPQNPYTGITQKRYNFCPLAQHEYERLFSCLPFMKLGGLENHKLSDSSWTGFNRICPSCRDQDQGRWSAAVP